VQRMPALFVSHGSPQLAVQDSLAGRFLDGLAAQLPAPKAIVVASAHYESQVISIGAAPSPRTVHDFRGFPAELYALHYPAPGAPALAESIARHLRMAGLDSRLESTRGLDHGVWVPLRRAYPAADIPVVPISVDPRGDARAHFNIGRALAPLRDEGVLVIGSGGFVHNLGALQWRDVDAPMPSWATEFASWMRDRLAAVSLEPLLDWQAAPHARMAHPTLEHLMPLFVALGAGGTEPRVEALHRSNEYGSLALDAFAIH
jgi:4,5-DOPA dioxygenase extradiol